MMKENGKLAKPILIATAGRNKDTSDEAEKASEKAIQSAIDAARGSIQKNVPTPADIWVAADNAEKKLESLKIPVADRPGAIVHFRPEGPSAKSYKYAQNTIEMQAERKRDGWVMTHVGRTLVYPQQPETERLFLTPKQRDIAMERGMMVLQQKFSVQEPRQPKPQAQRAPEQGVGIGG
ncbi:MAG: hypothetical protein HKL99_14490 [Burkholderiales bacterium]|nr:hypothetical protein [Burkholderiales bacterium]